MPPLSPLELRPLENQLEELPPHARLPRLDLGIDWESSGEIFRTSLAGVFTSQPTPKDWELKRIKVPRVDWIEGKLPGRAFMAASLWHVVVIWLLISPIWGFLPEVKPTLAPVQIELTLYDPPDLPRINLPANTPKPVKKPDEIKQPVEKGADAFHPRQTIISIPVHITHPRQTLIRPDAPPAPPKIVTPLPNIVQWSVTELKRPRLELAPTASAPRLRHRVVAATMAPDVPNTEKNPGPINIAPSAAAITRPKIVIDAMSTSVAQRHAMHADAGPAPEIGAAAEEGDAGMRRLIALSATPAPPALEVNVPNGNLAARISISPEGGKPGAPAATEHGISPGESGAGSVTAAGVANNAGGASGNSLPASVSISAAPPHPGNRGTGGGITPSGRRGGLILKPMTPYEPSRDTRRGPADVSSFDPSLPPEKILSGKEVYTLHVNLPNLTSASGSWILHFAELDEEIGTPYKHKEQVSGPVPLSKSDPKYPPELIKAHVRGEVVLYAIIRKDGSVDSIQIVRGLDPQLDRNAIEAFGQWKFQPGTRAGVPVDLEAVVHVPFTYVDPRDYGPQ